MRRGGRRRREVPLGRCGQRGLRLRALCPGDLLALPRLEQRLRLPLHHLRHRRRRRPLWPGRRRRRGGALQGRGGGDSGQCRHLVGELKHAGALRDRLGVVQLLRAARHREEVRSDVQGALLLVSLDELHIQRQSCLQPRIAGRCERFRDLHSGEGLRGHDLLQVAGHERLPEGRLDHVAAIGERPERQLPRDLPERSPVPEGPLQARCHQALGRRRRGIGRRQATGEALGELRGQRLERLGAQLGDEQHVVPDIHCPERPHTCLLGGQLQHHGPLPAASARRPPRARPRGEERPHDASAVDRQRHEL
mmetsp:Transcript_24847/g.70730  ORF Transcript_24847/g.70730 Transcript_24847/m.70730 type:complete len:308 (-) Transcript_24847:898-1821(-)